MFYIFHGDDEFRRAEFLQTLKARMGDPAMADLNTTTLDGRTVTLQEITDACNTMPFASDRRLVIVDGLLSRLRASMKASEKKGRADLRTFEEKLLAYVEDSLPPTARLVFLEPGKLDSKAPLAKSPIVKLARKRYPNHVKSFDRPAGYELTRWITQRVQQQGGEIERPAATELAAIAGDDLRHVSQEIDKLVLYARGTGPITVDAVRELVADARETSIFDLVDAVGRRDEKRALGLLHHLLDEGSAPAYLMAMITRQVRILLQVKTLVARGVVQKDVASRLRLHPYVVQKVAGQVRNFSVDQLRRAFERIMEVDLAVKTGRIDAVAGLDLLVVALSRDQVVVLPTER